MAVPDAANSFRRHLLIQYCRRVALLVFALGLFLRVAAGEMLRLHYEPLRHVGGIFGLLAMMAGVPSATG